MSVPSREEAWDLFCEWTESDSLRRHHLDPESGHPRIALELFAERGYPRELIDAVAGHATYLGVPRETRRASPPQ